VDIRTYVCIIKKSICFSIRSSFSFSFFFGTFYPVFCSFSCLRRSSILGPQCFFVYSMHFYIALCLLWWEEKERNRANDEKAIQWCEMLMCVCARALIDYIFYLSMKMMRTRKTRASLLPVYFESSRFLFLFLMSTTENYFFARHHRTKKKKVEEYKIDK